MGASGSSLLALFGVVALFITACGAPVDTEDHAVTPLVPVESTSTSSAGFGADATTTTGPMRDAGAEEDILGDELGQLLQDLIDGDATADALEGVPELQ
jgi:hypothetical protein